MLLAPFNIQKNIRHICKDINIYQIEPHKAVAKVSKKENLLERFVVVSHGWQIKATDGSKSGWRQRSVVVLVVAM